MLIDWFTVGAQALNFMILVWLMKRFLYRPVLASIATREQQIQAQLADAARTKDEAVRQEAEFRQKNQDFDMHRAASMLRVENEVDAERDRLRNDARATSDAASAMRVTAQLADARELRADLTRRAQAAVFDIARHVLRDLAATRLEQRACEVFIERLRAIDPAAMTALRAAAGTTSEASPALLRSAFALSLQERAVVLSALEDVLGQALIVRFETDPELVAGIELAAGGQKLSWSVSHYLEALSSDLEQRLALPASA